MNERRKRKLAGDIAYAVEILIRDARRWDVTGSTLPGTVPDIVWNFDDHDLLRRFTDHLVGRTEDCITGEELTYKRGWTRMGRETPPPMTPVLCRAGDYIIIAEMHDEVEGALFELDGTRHDIGYHEEWWWRIVDPHPEGDERGENRQSSE